MLNANQYFLLFYSLQRVEGTGIKKRQETAVVHSPRRQTEFNQLSCGSQARHQKSGP